MSTPLHRYHVCCDHCHFVGSERTKDGARLSVKAHFHGPKASIFDSMARIGAPQTWSFSDGFRWQLEQRRAA